MAMNRAVLWDMGSLGVGKPAAPTGWGHAIASAAPRANIGTILDVLYASRCFQAIAAGMKSIGVNQNCQLLPADVVVRSLDLLEANAFNTLSQDGASSAVIHASPFHP
jgi:hypothetical protein